MIHPNVPTRGFLLSDEEPSKEHPVKGYLLLPSRANSENFIRYLHVCESYLRHFDITADFKGKAPMKSLMPTYWLLDFQAHEIKTMFGSHSLFQLRCSTLIDFYDYSRAKIILGRAKSLSLSGPVLAAWSTRSNHHEFLILDLSNFNENEFHRAMLIWKERIVMNPSLWKDGFNLIKAKEEFRSLLQKYG